MKNTLKIYLVTHEEFTKHIACNGIHFDCSYVSDTLTSGMLTRNDLYLALVDIWYNSTYVELYVKDEKATEIESIFKGRWAK